MAVRYRFRGLDLIDRVPDELWMEACDTIQGTGIKIIPKKNKCKKARVVKAMVFPVVMYGCESWTIKKAEPRRIDAFELWCWRRLLRVPWIARRSNQTILKVVSPECSLEGLTLKLKLQYFGYLM